MYQTTTYPTAVDVPVNPNGSSDTSTFDHAGLHTFENQAIAALETKVGANSSVDTNSLDYKVTALQTAVATNASTSAKGVTKLSVAPVSATEPIAVGTNDTRIPTAGQGQALAGSQGVPSQLNTFVTTDNVYTAETDQTQATQNGTVEVGMANTTGNKNYLAQSFIPVKTKIRGVKLYKSANTGTFTGTVTVSLQADASGSPTGTPLATVTISNANYLALATGEFDAIFSAEYSMTAGSLYWIVIQCSTTDTSNHPNLGTNTAGGYANGSVKYYNGTDSWVAIATIDLYFKTLQGVKSQVLFIDSTGKIMSSNGLNLTNVGLFSSGATTKDASDASTTQTIAHGLGRIPLYVKIDCSLFNSTTYRFAKTIYNGTTQSSQSYYATNGGQANDNTFTLNTNNAAATTIGTITVDATNINIAWVKSGSPTGVYQLLWEARA